MPGATVEAEWVPGRWHRGQAGHWIEKASESRTTHRLVVCKEAIDFEVKPKETLGKH